MTQELLVRQLIADKTPHQLKMLYALWTRSAMGELIEQCFGIMLSVRGVGVYLKRWGFTPQEPTKKACEQSQAAVKKWLKQDYPAIAAHTKNDGAEIQWDDEGGLRNDDIRGRGCAPVGQTPVARVDNKRHGLYGVSTVTHKGQMLWRIFEGALNTDILLDFLRRLIRCDDRKILPILNNLRVLHSMPVNAWPAANRERIEVFYLPSYSPELNPDEMANADLKQAVKKLAPA